jgi:putative phage-type endonuclease
MITEQQKQKRKKRIGSSDVAAIVGLDPFKSPYDVFLEKTGKLEGEQKETEAMTEGKFEETGLILYAQSLLGFIIKKPSLLEFASQELNGLIVSHPDGLVKATGNRVEAKRQTYYARKESEMWGEPGSDQVPDRVVIQTSVHILCSPKSDVCHIPASLPFRKWEMFAVKRNNDLIASIIEFVDNFWQNNVLKDTPPSDSKPALAVIKRIRHIPDKTISIPADIALNWDKARQNRLAAEKTEDKHLTDLLAVIGDAEAGICYRTEIVDGKENHIPTGDVVTLFETQRTIYKVPEEIRKQYAEITKYRTPRLKKEK